MASCEELEKELEKIKSNQSSEFELRPIEKWMCNDLGVSRLKSTGGSIVRYEHPAFEELKGSSIFTIHLKHRSKREVIYRTNFLNFLYKRLKEIIEYMRKEGLCDSEKP